MLTMKECQANVVTNKKCVLSGKVDLERDTNFIKKYFSEPKKIFETITSETCG